MTTLTQIPFALGFILAVLAFLGVLALTVFVISALFRFDDPEDDDNDTDNGPDLGDLTGPGMAY